ncbi:cytochrome P450 18a1-like isoform X2 [Leptidea sinapis]|uniref:cytochrome P450 18a1-like isoform X2 n=1 Tax=Leptidea sinapis TaxID=189913 RepID=UPI0021C487FF|nr:cytochrome P450 18a1-like isoform X2 [Leptidea sinapis]
MRQRGIRWEFKIKRPPQLDSTARPHTPLNGLLGGFGIVLSEGELWKRQRQFLTEKFRLLGVKLWKNQPFEKYIITEVQELLKKIDNSKDIPLDPMVVLGRHVHNVICELMMSFRFEEGDPNFALFNERISRGMELYGSVHVGEHLACYLKLPGKMAVIKEIKKNLTDISKFHEDHLRARLEKQLKSYRYFDEDIFNFYIKQLHDEYPAEELPNLLAKKTDICTLEDNIADDLQPEQNPFTNDKVKDLLHCFLEQIQNEKKDNDAPSIFVNKNKVKQVVQVMNDLFSAGMETSRTSIVWILIMMLREPKVAEKVRSDLAEVVGTGELVTLEHRLDLPYVEAVIYETLRRVSVVPLGTTHVNLNDWKIQGFTIPSGSSIIPLLNKINMDPNYFPDPEKFLPERFLLDGKLFVPDYFMPFGVGRRVCLGEQLARMELFLFFANLMNYYEFALPEGESMPSLEGSFGTTHAAHPYTLVFRKLVA